MNPKLIYDGDCGFCIRSVQWVKERDTEQRIDYVPYQSVSDGEFTATDRARFPEAMHFLDTDGTISYGGHALPHILNYLPRWRKWSWFFRLSGVLWFAARIYRQIAKRRHMLGSPVCKV